MSQQLSFRKIFLGLAAGLLSTPVGLIFAYIVGVLGTAAKTRDLFATLLTAATFLPIMLALMLAIPTLVVTTLSGLTLGLIANFSSRFLVILGTLIGLVSSVIVLSLVLPLVVEPQPGDFTSIISNYLLSGAYGVVLGGLTGLLFRWMNRAV
jgi:hypothetical protein